MLKQRGRMVFTVLLLAAFAQASAQQCAVLEAMPQGAYLVSIEDEKMLAITRDMAAEPLKQVAILEALKKEIAAKEALLESLLKAEGHYQQLVDRQREYITGLEQTMQGYKELARDYKKLSGEPWLTFDIGLGATGGDTDPAVLAGVAIKRFKVWGFLQEENSGVLIGTTLPLF